MYNSEKQLNNTSNSTSKPTNGDLQLHMYILAIHLNVKFSCKMSLEYNGQILIGTMLNNSSENHMVRPKTTRNQTDQQIFHINTHIILKPNQNHQPNLININLTTTKGANYFAGLIKFTKNQLLQKNCQSLVLKLQKCLDPDAFCEAKLHQLIHPTQNINHNTISSQYQSIPPHLQPPNPSLYIHPNHIITNPSYSILIPQNIQTHNTKQYTNKNIIDINSDQHINHNQKIQYLNKSVQRDHALFQSQRLKIQINILESKLQGITNQAKQKQNSILEKFSKSQKQVIQLKSKLSSLIANNQGLNERMHNKQIENLKYQIDLENSEKYINQLKLKLNQLQDQFKNIQNQNLQLFSSNKQKQLKIQHMKEDYSALKAKYLNLTIQNNKNIKKLQTTQQQNLQYKQQITLIGYSLQQKVKLQQTLQQKIEKINNQKSKLQLQLEQLTYHHQSYKNNIEEIIKTIPKVNFKQSSIDSINENLQQKSFIYMLFSNENAIQPEIKYQQMKKRVSQYITYNDKDKIKFKNIIKTLQVQNQYLTNSLTKLNKQYQKSQNILFDSMNKFSDQFQQMSIKYTHQIQRYNQQIKQLTREIMKKDKQFQEYNQRQQKHKNQINNLRHYYQAEIVNLNSKFKQQIQIYTQKLQQAQYNIQLAKLKTNQIENNYSISLKQINTSNQKFEQQKIKSQKRNKQINQLLLQNSSLKSQIQNSKSLKQELNMEILDLKSEVHKNLQLIQCYQNDIKIKEKIVVQQRLKCENLLREKQIKYKEQIQKQNKINFLKQQIFLVKELNNNLVEKYESYNNQVIQSKKITKELNYLLKQSEDKYNDNQKKKNQLVEKVVQLQKNILQKNQNAQNAEIKLINQIDELQKEKKQINRLNQLEKQNLRKIIEEKNLTTKEKQIKITQLEKQVKRIQNINHSLQQTIYAQKHQNMEKNNQIQSITRRKQQLQNRQEELQAMVTQLHQQIRGKQQKIFGLSSKLYQYENKLKLLQKNKFQNILSHNIKKQSKFQRLTNQYPKKNGKNINNIGSSQIPNLVSQRQVDSKSSRGQYQIQQDLDDFNEDSISIRGAKRFQTQQVKISIKNKLPHYTRNQNIKIQNIYRRIHRH